MIFLIFVVFILILGGVLVLALFLGAVSLIREKLNRSVKRRQ
jgi:hypothetical protein